MKLFASAFLAATLLSTVAMADPVLSIFPKFSLGPYAGLRAGWASSSDPVLGANFGYDLGLIRLEADYDRLGLRSSSANVFTGNSILQFPVTEYVTPYVLAGAGYEFKNADNQVFTTANWSSGSGVWTLGGGLRFELTRYTEIDTRYRYIQPFSYSGNPFQPYKGGEGMHVITTGVNWKF